MSIIQIRRTRTALVCAALALCAAAGLCVACIPTNAATVAFIGVLGETEVKLPMTYVLSALCVLGLYFIKQQQKKLEVLEAIVTGPDGHGERLAHGDEQLKLLKKVAREVEQIARACPRVKAAAQGDDTPPPC